jgi:hypothetical protein
MLPVVAVVVRASTTTLRGVEAIVPSLKLLDLTMYGRQAVWEDSPDG